MSGHLEIQVFRKNEETSSVSGTPAALLRYVARTKGETVLLCRQKDSQSPYERMTVDQFWLRYAGYPRTIVRKPPEPLRQSSQGLPSKVQRFRILKRDNYRCTLCGHAADEGARLEVDHIIARAKGGTNDDNNLHTLCFGCNRGKRTESL
jgi:hypothetical protein